MNASCPSCGKDFDAGSSADEAPGVVGLVLCEACAHADGAPPPPRASVPSALSGSDLDRWSDGPESVEPVSLRDLEMVLAPPSRWGSTGVPDERGAPARPPVPKPAPATETPTPLSPVVVSKPRVPAAKPAGVVVPAPRPVGKPVIAAKPSPVDDRLIEVKALPPLPSGADVPPPRAPMPSSTETRTAARAPHARPVLTRALASMKEAAALNVEATPRAPTEPPKGERAPDSGQIDLAKLAAAHPSERPRPADKDLFILQGGLFGDARPRPASLPPPTLDADPISAPMPLLATVPAESSPGAADDDETTIDRSAMSPPRALEPAARRPPPRRVPFDDDDATLDRSASSVVLPMRFATSKRVGVEDDDEATIERLPPPSKAPLLLAPVLTVGSSRPPRAADTTPPARTSTRAPVVTDSGAPGPASSERGRKRGGIASWAIAVSAVSLSAAVIVVTLHDGGSKQAATDATTRTTAGPAPTAPNARTGGETAPSPTTATPRTNDGTSATTATKGSGTATSVATPPPASTPASAPVNPKAGGAPTVANASPDPPPPPVHAAVTPPPVERPAPPPPTPPPAAPPPSGGGGSFDQGAARAALSAAAATAAGCKQPDDPSGGARVSVVFSTSGRVSSAQVTGGPFQGTKTGACIAGAFRGVSVPAFEGDPVSVTKSVTIP